MASLRSGRHISHFSYSFITGSNVDGLPGPPYVDEHKAAATTSPARWSLLYSTPAAGLNKIVDMAAGLLATCVVMAEPL